MADRGAIKSSLELLAQPWTMRILLALRAPDMNRFQDLIDRFDSLPPNTLSNRLKRLLEIGAVERNRYQEHPVRLSYSLTDKGRALGDQIALLEILCDEIDRGT